MSGVEPELSGVEPEGQEQIGEAEGGEKRGQNRTKSHSQRKRSQPSRPKSSSGRRSSSSSGSRKESSSEDSSEDSSDDSSSASEPEPPKQRSKKKSSKPKKGSKELDVIVKNLKKTHKAMRKLKKAKSRQSTTTKFNHRYLEIQYEINSDVLDHLKRGKIDAATKVLEQRNRDILMGDKYKKYFEFVERHREIKRSTKGDDNGEVEAFFKAHGADSDSERVTKRQRVDKARKPFRKGGNSYYPGYAKQYSLTSLSVYPSFLLPSCSSSTDKTKILHSLDSSKTRVHQKLTGKDTLGRSSQTCHTSTGTVIRSKGLSPAILSHSDRDNGKQRPTVWDSQEPRLAERTGGSDASGPATSVVHTGESVIGSLKRHISFWKKLGVSAPIRKVLEEGYLLPFRVGVQVQWRTKV